MPIPMTSPGSVSKTSTPSMVAVAAMKSGRAPMSRRCGSNRPVEHGTACERLEVDQFDEGGDHHRGQSRSGRSAKRPVRKRRVTMVRAATTSPDTWLLAPPEAFTAVFERLPLTTIPLVMPAPMLAAPRRDQLTVVVDLVVERAA